MPKKPKIKPVIKIRPRTMNRKGVKSGTLKSFAFKKGVRRGKRVFSFKSLTACVRELMRDSASLVPAIAEFAENLGLDPDCTPIGAVLAGQVIVNAMDGNAALVKEIFDRTEGKIPEVVINKIDTLGDMTDEDLKSFLTNEFVLDKVEK